MITQGASILIAYLLNVMGAVTNRTTQALVKAIILWYGNRLSNKLFSRHHTTADVLSVLEVAVDLDYQHVLYGFCLSVFLRIYIPDPFFPLNF